MADPPARTRCDASLRTREEREKDPSHTSLRGWFPAPGRSNTGSAAGTGVGGVLEGVVERLELDPQGELDQAVRQPHVLGEQRAVQVGTDHVAAVHALEA